MKYNFKNSLPRLAPDVFSEVEDFEGPSISIWLNNSYLDNTMDGGVSGFFRRVVKFGGLLVKNFMVL